ncbi:MAG: hypothetical protein JO227_17410 [Acetobacteraceae bacterium]|nr:hypothetical protein [Acetobacteraceae bacterium]
MIEQVPLVPYQWEIETDVVVAGFRAAGFSGDVTSDPVRVVAAYEPSEGGKIV